ncbi:MAG: ABC transporter ATP-binding protein, partial [Anaerolineales bacterium]|nr:ABC transporter ATP-binding protein [Anaerolineales bacterium]
MSFSIGSSMSAGMGPRGALENFGSKDFTGGKVFSRRVVARMLNYLKPYIFQMGLAAVLMVAASMLTLWIPYLQKVAIDQNITGRDLPGLARTAFYLGAAFVGLYLTAS